MYPTISDLIKDIFGIYIPLPIQSFGFFVAVAFLIGGYFWSLELKRKEDEGLLQPNTIKVLKGKKATVSELIFSAIVGFIIGYKLIDAVFNYSQLVENPQEFILSFKGNFIGGLAIASLSAYLKYQEKEKEKLETPIWVEETIHPYQLTGNLTMVSAVSGIIGAKIFHNLENPADFLADPVGALLSFSGLTMYGGLICGAIAVIYYGSKNKIPYRYLIDSCAPTLMIGYGIGRIGCHVSGDGDWGIPNDAPMPDWLSWLPDWTWAYNYPNNVLGWNLKEKFIEDGFVSITGNAYPTPFYEAVVSILLFCFLWSIRKKIKVAGVLFCAYLILNGTERFFIEKIRVNETYSIFGFHPTQAEIISVMLVIIGITGIFYFRKQEQKVTDLQGF